MKIIQNIYHKIEEYIDLMIIKGYSANYILEQLRLKGANYYDSTINKAKNAQGNIESPIHLLSEFLKGIQHPKPVYLSDLTVHTSVRQLFEALYNLVADYELYIAPPCDSNEFLTIEEHFEVKLPKSFKDFYSITNGQYRETIPIFGYYYLVQINHIIEISETGLKYAMPNGKENYFSSSKPIAFAYNEDSNILWLDFDTLSENNKMKVITTDVDFNTINVIADSFEAFLNNVTNLMEKPENTLQTINGFRWESIFYKIFVK